MHGQTESHLWGIPRVVEHIGVREIRSAELTQPKFSQVRMRNVEIKLSKTRPRAALVDKAKPIIAELVPRINDNQIIWLEKASNIIDSDRDNPFWCHDA
jgi:hypothetical protein